MEPLCYPDRIDIPPDLLAKIREAADEEQRSAVAVLQDAVMGYMQAKRRLQQPSYLRERAAALGLIDGGPSRRLVRRVSEMSDAELDAIGNTAMDPRHNHLDAELK